MEVEVVDVVENFTVDGVGENGKHLMYGEGSVLSKFLQRKMIHIYS